jgi:hypothetical protein
VQVCCLDLHVCCTISSDAEGDIEEHSRGIGVLFLPTKNHDEWSLMMSNEDGDGMSNVGLAMHHNFINTNLGWTPSRNVRKYFACELCFMVPRRLNYPIG